jgi:RNA polymerase sigma-70 factor (ECF subfamily)
LELTFDMLDETYQQHPIRELPLPTPGTTERATSLPGIVAPAGEMALVQRLRHRDSAALTELYDIYGRLVYSLILRIVRDGGIAEDLVQETFFRVWTRVSLFDSQKGTFGTWLLTVARNRALDYLRSSHGRWSYSAQTLYETSGTNLFPDLEASVSLGQRVGALRAALQKLSVNQRAVIDLAYFEGYSQTEMAARLGHPLGTVKTWVRSALKTLRVECEESMALKASRTVGLASMKA